MKKTLTLALACVMAASLFAPASAGAPKKQTVEGTIAAFVRHPDGCYSGVSRHLYSLIGDASNGLVGWTFDVDKATWKGKFTLEPSGGVGVVDLDITYYLGDFATLEEWVNSPAPAPPATQAYEDRTAPGEKGTVPEGAVKAIVCTYASESGAAVGVPFTYEATAPVKKKKK